MCCELRTAHVTAKPSRRPFKCVGATLGCKTQKTAASPCHSTMTPYYKGALRTTKHYSVIQGTTLYCKALLRTTKSTMYFKVCYSITPYYKVLLFTTPYLKNEPQIITPYNCVKHLQHVCSIVIAHETSSTVRGATYGMQNVM